MTSLKQIEANRLNALKSTGPRTEEGKQRSRQNALRHGLTAETVITALENAADYRNVRGSIASDYQPRSATEREWLRGLPRCSGGCAARPASRPGCFKFRAS